MSGLQGAFDNHIDVNSVGPEGETALILAIQHDRVEAVRALLAHGANPNTPNARGLTPIRAARVRNNYNVLQALQHAGR
jgi:ankyrin repeat protein